jgi:hypothetical protein
MVPRQKHQIRLQKPDRLCQYCRRISIHSLRSRIASPPSCWREEAFYTKEFSGTQGMKHLENARDLEHSANICDLCSLLAEKFLSNFRSWKPIEEKPIYLSPFLVYMDMPYHHRSFENFPYSSEYCGTLLGMEVWVPVDNTTRGLTKGYYHFGLRFYTDDGKLTFHLCP